ncbi:MAG TPA: TIGR02281 family clan AA aspartic protease [Allosphingosinicella sp.]|nr:TIGR02281 family clan AA aspartic protease [Allosphingosinicella sp.]
MEKPFLFVIALGAAIGLMLPASHRAAPAAPQPPASKAVAPAPADDPPPLETKLERAPNGHFYADGNVDGQPVRLVVDTGATMVALTVADARRIGLPFSPNEFTIIGTGASGPVRGSPVMLDRVEIGGREVRGVPGAVVEGLDVSLLGQTYLGRIGSVQMSGDTMTLR